MDYFEKKSEDLYTKIHEAKIDKKTITEKK